jgi:hypothetical protein
LPATLDVSFGYLSGCLIRCLLAGGLGFFLLGLLVLFVVLLGVVALAHGSCPRGGGEKLELKKWHSTPRGV